EAEGRSLADVKPDEWSGLDARLGPEVQDLLSAEVSIVRRATPGGPSRGSVEAQIARLRALLAPG
ncbi:MAG TPA: argininosuccinate lyase, partial [Actinomycetota bacterium]